MWRLLTWSTVIAAAGIGFVATISLIAAAVGPDTFGKEHHISPQRAAGAALGAAIISAILLVTAWISRRHARSRRRGGR